MKQTVARNRKKNESWHILFNRWVAAIIRFAIYLFSDPFGAGPQRKTARRKLIRKKKPPEKKKQTTISLEKAPENPILGPNSENGWEAWQTFNPGAVLLGDDVHFLYRAVGIDGVSRLGYAVSRDGLTIDERLTYPVYEHTPNGSAFSAYSYGSGGSWGGAEDPRLVHIGGENRIYMTYTACSNDGLRVGITSIGVRDFLERNWRWSPPALISPPGEVHKNWVLFPEKIAKKYAILHSINPAISIANVSAVTGNKSNYVASAFGGKVSKNGGWEKLIRGAGPAPIKTKHGWLLLYHAMDDDQSKYRVGAMLLDIQNPSKILRRSSAPILEPTEPYEYNGFKGGVVYASGAVVKNGTLFVYYGSADSYVCAATAPFEEFMSALLNNGAPTLKQKRVRKKII